MTQWYLKSVNRLSSASDIRIGGGPEVVAPTKIYGATLVLFTVPLPVSDVIPLVISS